MDCTCSRCGAILLPHEVDDFDGMCYHCFIEDLSGFDDGDIEPWEGVYSDVD